jgi:hypothetical protein
VSNHPTITLRRRVRRFWIYWMMRVWVWWNMRRTAKAFEWVLTLPRAEALIIVTRWRWQIAHAEGVTPEIQDAYLAAIDRLAQAVSPHRKTIPAEP